MSISRFGPIMNFDTQQVITPDKKRIFTRSMLCRILKKNGIAHDVNWGYDKLVELMYTYNVPFEPIAPGIKVGSNADRIRELEAELAKLKSVPDNVIEIKSPELARDGYPKSVWVLRKILREKNIPHNKTDKRQALIDKLNGKNTS